ncbi:MAG: NAD(+)/NADH kinase [Oscillospiraceae bacterium]|nr:NAD(+)/NADH kinase [Oscillospiraceae bacterium]
MKVFILVKQELSHNSDADTVYESVLKKLKQFDIELVDDITDCDAYITIGGDGTILKAGAECAVYKKPLLGINTGRLGFMATLEKDSLDKLERLKNGDFKTNRRMLIEARVGERQPQILLNDVVLHRGAVERLPDFSVTRNGTEVIRVRADGIIISTPTGSTAYSLSAGGPIIEPELECFLVTALCPHTLFNRPMVFSPNGSLEISANNVSVCMDGGDGIILKENEKVVITKSEYCLEIIDIDGNNFYNAIHNKLMNPLK